VGSVVQKSTGAKHDFSGATSYSESLPSLPTAGNGVVCLINFEGGENTGPTATGVVDSNGANLTKIQSYAQQNSNGSSEQWWIPSVGASSGTYSVTVSFPGSYVAGIRVQLIEITGFGTSIDQYNAAGGTTSPVSVTNPAANGAATDIVFAMGCSHNYNPGANPTYPPTGFTDLSYDNDSAQWNEFAYKICTSVETSTASWPWTTSGSEHAEALIFSIKPAGGGGPTVHPYMMMGMGM